MAERFTLEGLDRIRQREENRLELEGLDELRRRSGTPPETPPQGSPQPPQSTISPQPGSGQPPAQPGGSRGLPIPGAPTEGESDAVRALIQEREARRARNPSNARTVGEFLQFSGEKLVGQLRDNAKRVWKGVVQGELSTYQWLDNVAAMVSDAVGVDKTLFFEEMIAKQSELLPDVQDNGIVDRLFTSVGTAAMEIPKVAIFSKVPGGLPAFGAVGAYQEGPLEMAKEAAIWGLIGRVFHATGNLPKSDRAVIIPTTMASLELASGGSTEDVLVAGITGYVLGTMGPQGRDISLAQRLRDRITANPKVMERIRRKAKQDLLRSGADLSKVIKAEAETFMKENMGVTRSVLEGGKVGRTEIATKDVNLLQKLDESLSDALRLTSQQQKAMTTQQKLDTYLQKFDPKGHLKPEGRERIVQSLLRSMDAAQAKVAGDLKAVRERPQSDVDASASTSRQAFDSARRRRTEDELGVTKRIRNSFNRAFVDVSANIHRELLKAGGKAGEKVIDLHNAINGAVNSAHQHWQRYQTVVGNRLGFKDRDPFAEIIFHRANVERYKHRPGRKAPLLGRIDGKTSEESLIKLRQQLGEERFGQLYELADNHFAWMNERLLAMRDAGLVSQKQVDKVIAEGYAPMTFLQAIDPLRQVTVGGKTITVPSSGINYPKRLGKDLVMDPRDIAAEVAARSTTRIAQNQAQLAMVEFAQQYPNNPLVRLPARVKHDKKGRAKAIPPEGFIRVDGLVEGKQQPLFINKAYADEWVRMNPQMSRTMGNFFRLTSGSFIVRPLATGYNPFFILTNFPRDMAHVWVTTSEYSPILPYYGLQSLRDLMAVFPDTVRRKGRWQDYINEGGGMSFLTHQGLTQFERGFTRDIARAELQPRLAKTKQTLGYLNETSEIWVRLMLRERAMRNGKSPFEATQIARGYLDFAQGGYYSKGLDHMIPYFNAAIQGTRGIFRHARRNPIEAGAKWLQLIALEGLFEMANYSVNPEAATHIPYEEKARNWIFTTPWSFVDNWGNIRHGYFRVRKDQSIIPFTGIATSLMEKGITGRDPPGSVLSLIKEAMPVGPGTIPTVDAIYSYIFNKDLWSQADIWKGMNVMEEEEYYAFGPGGRQPTNPLAIALGRNLGLSPARLEHSIGRFIPNNPYTQAMGWLMRKSIEGVTPYDLSRTTEEMVAHAPFVKQMFAWTHPFSHEVDLFEENVQTANVPIQQMRRDMDEMYAMYQTNQLDGGVGTIRAWINNLPVEFRESMHERLQGRIVVDQAFKELRSTPGLDTYLPSKTWWVASRGEVPEVRAEVYYEKWKERGRREREIMDRLMSRIPGYRTDRFEYRFRKLKASRGTEVEE